MALDANYFFNQACNFAYNRQSHFLVFISLFFVVWPFFKTSNEWSLRKSVVVMAGAVILLHLDSILLGALGPREWGDDGRAWVGFMPYLAKNRNFFEYPCLWKLFSGTPFFGACPFGANIICLRSLLFDHLPPHGALLVLRLLVSTSACFGMFLICKQCGASPKSSTWISIAFLTAYDFNSTLTFQYGLDLAGLPMLLWSLTNQKPKITLLQIVCLLVFISLSTVFYTVTKVLILFLFLSLLFPTSFQFSFIKTTTFVIAWFANNSISMWGFKTLLSESTREDLIVSPAILNGIRDIFNWLNRPYFLYNQGGFFLFLAMLGLLLVTVIGREKKPLIILIFAILTWFSTPFLSAFPWEKIGLAFLKSYRWYLEYTVFIMSGIFYAYLALKTQNKPHLSRGLLSIFAATSFTYFIVSKAGRIENASFYGNLSHQFAVPNLKENLSVAFTDQKVLGLPYLFDANSLPNYGLFGFNGWTSLPSKSLLQFWDRYVILQKKGTMYESSLLKFPENFYNVSEAIQVEKFLSLDALKVLGVGYITSQHPLATCKKLVSLQQDNCQSYNLKEKILSPSKNILLYKIPDPLPLVYSCNNACYEDLSSLQSSTIQHALKGSLVLKKQAIYPLKEKRHEKEAIKKIIYKIDQNKIIIQTDNLIKLVVINFPFSKSLKAITIPDLKPIQLYESAFGQIYFNNNNQPKTVEIF